jgi:hypothetical protein
MKRFFLLCILGGLCASARAQADFDWVAPQPPLPDTVYWDYGWDSTSNGIPPSLEFLQSERVARVRVFKAPPALPPALPAVPTRRRAIVELHLHLHL